MCSGGPAVTFERAQHTSLTIFWASHFINSTNFFNMPFCNMSSMILGSSAVMILPMHLSAGMNIFMSFDSSNSMIRGTLFSFYTIKAITELSWLSSSAQLLNAHILSYTISSQSTKRPDVDINTVFIIYIYIDYIIYY